MDDGLTGALEVLVESRGMNAVLKGLSRVAADKAAESGHDALEKRLYNQVSDNLSIIADTVEVQ